MTYCWYWLMTRWELERVAVMKIPQVVSPAGERSDASATALASLRSPRGETGSQHNLRPPPPVRVNLQQERVPEPPVDHVDLAHPRPQAVQARLDLRQHPRVDHPLGDQPV